MIHSHTYQERRSRTQRQRKRSISYGTESSDLCVERAFKYVVDELGVCVDPNIGVFDELEEDEHIFFTCFSFIVSEFIVAVFSNTEFLL